MKNLDFWAAIPDSTLTDEQTMRDKTTKIAQFARAFSIFSISKETTSLAIKILESYKDYPHFNLVFSLTHYLTVVC